MCCALAVLSEILIQFTCSVSISVSAAESDVFRRRDGDGAADVRGQQPHNPDSESPEGFFDLRLHILPLLPPLRSPSPSPPLIAGFSCGGAFVSEEAFEAAVVDSRGGGHVQEKRVGRRRGNGSRRRVLPVDNFYILWNQKQRSLLPFLVPGHQW